MSSLFLKDDMFSFDALLMTAKLSYWLIHLISSINNVAQAKNLIVILT